MGLVQPKIKELSPLVLKYYTTLPVVGTIKDGEMIIYNNAGAIQIRCSFPNTGTRGWWWEPMTSY